MNKTFRLSTSSVEERNALMALAFKCGCLWHDSSFEPNTAVEAEQKWPQGTYGTLNVNLGQKNISGGSGGTDSIAEYLIEVAKLYPSPQLVKTSDDYDAIRHEDGIKVGCTFVSRAKLQEVNKLVFGKEA